MGRSQSPAVLHEGPNLLADGSPLVRLAAVGDVMLGFGVAQRMQEEGAGYPFKGIRHLLQNSDVRFANLEFPLTETRRRHPVIRHRPTYAPPRSVGALKDANFNVVSIANNHILDCLDEGLADTVSILKSYGIACAGAGSNLAAARAPALRTINGVRLGFLAYTYPLYQIATPDTAGCAPNDPEVMKEDVRNLKIKVDHVIVSIHAGSELEFYPTVQCQETSHMILREGASAILYHHPHVPRGIEQYEGGLVAYGLGNFICDLHDEYFQSIMSPHVRKGMILYLDLDASRVLSVEIQPTIIDAEVGVHSVEEPDREQFFEFMNAISSPLYDVAALEDMQPRRSVMAKMGKLLRKARMKGVRALAGELTSDVLAELDRKIFEPAKLRALARQLKSSSFHIEPNPLPSANREG